MWLFWCYYRARDTCAIVICSRVQMDVQLSYGFGECLGMDIELQTFQEFVVIEWMLWSVVGIYWWSSRWRRQTDTQRLRLATARKRPHTRRSQTSCDAHTAAFLLAQICTSVCVNALLDNSRLVGWKWRRNWVVFFIYVKVPEAFFPLVKFLNSLNNNNNNNNNNEVPGGAVCWDTALHVGR